MNSTNENFVHFVREIFDNVVSSGVLDAISTVDEFRSFAYNLFLDCRRTEIKRKLELISLQDPYIIVQNPCQTLLCCRQVRTCDEDLIKKYAKKYFDNPPINFLRDDVILHMYYIPEHFLIATRDTFRMKIARCKRILKLLADTSFTLQARILNLKEYNSL